VAYSILHGPEVSFNNVQKADIEDPSTFNKAYAVVIGAPFDGGALHTRVGALMGPSAIRTSYTLFDRHLTLGVRPLEDLNVVDIGDVYMPAPEILNSLNRLQKTVTRVAESGAIPIILGGDHSIMWPDVAGVAPQYGKGKLSVLQFDSHADTGWWFPAPKRGDVGWDLDSHTNELYRYGHGTMVWRLVESGVIRGDRFVQMGLRGYYPTDEEIKWMNARGIRWYPMDEIDDRGLDTCLDEAFKRLTDDCEAVFLSVDIDAVDPLLAPGTGGPEPGGFTTREILRAVRRCSLELPLAGLEVAEVSPPWDVSGMTAHLANRIILDALSGVAKRRQVQSTKPEGR